MVCRLELQLHQPPCTNKEQWPAGADPAFEFGEGHMEEIWGSGGEAPRKIFRGHALQTLGKRGKRPFCLILDHLVHPLIFLPSEMQLAFLYKRA